MKVLFILLAVLNLGFFAWQITKADTPVMQAEQAVFSNNNKPLVLMRELDAELAKTRSSQKSSASSAKEPDTAPADSSLSTQ